MVVHKSQVYKVPEGLSDAQAVLTEPIGVALHGVLKSLDEGGPTGATPAKVLVIGAGPIGLAVVVAIRLLGLPWHVTLPGPARRAAGTGLRARRGQRGGIEQGQRAARR